jgi:hypothetical protein
MGALVFRCFVLRLAEDDRALVLFGDYLRRSNSFGRTIEPYRRDEVQNIGTKPVQFWSFLLFRFFSSKLGFAAGSVLHVKAVPQHTTCGDVTRPIM